MISLLNAELLKDGKYRLDVFLDTEADLTKLPTWRNGSGFNYGEPAIGSTALVGSTNKTYTKVDSANWVLPGEKKVEPKIEKPQVSQPVVEQPKVEPQAVVVEPKPVEQPKVVAEPEVAPVNAQNI